MIVRLTRRSLLAGLALAPAAALAQRPRELEVPFVPTPHALVQKMLDLAQLRSEDFLIDLGCGDGRIAVAAGRLGARALGVDLDPLRIQEAHAAARIARVEGRVRFRRQDLFRTPIEEASVVAIYLMPEINLRLRPTLLTALQPGARVVSHAFDMGDWQADAQEEHDGRRIFLWVVPAVAGGSWELAEGGASRILELEQRFQMVTGTLGTRAATLPVSGRIRGTALTLASEAGEVRLDGRIEGDRIVPADGRASWHAIRAG